MSDSPCRYRISTASRWASGKQARADAAERVEDLRARLKAVEDQLGPPGKWYQANLQECTAFCKGKGLKSKKSKENAQCASGENRFDSATGKIVYTYGTWGGMRQSFKTQSEGIFCYGPNQKKDFDLTDRTVACFCGK